MDSMIKTDGGELFASYLHRVKPYIDEAIHDLSCFTQHQPMSQLQPLPQPQLPPESQSQLPPESQPQPQLPPELPPEPQPQPQPQETDAIEADLCRYLRDPLAQFIQGGGKRVRPALCLLAAEAVGGNKELALSSAVAIELFQAAALIHDDIADNGELRRGKPCLHISEGLGLAINAGDLALMRMYGVVLNDVKLDHALRHAVLCELQSMTERTVEGQALDIGWARDGRWDITGAEYLHMARLKTAYYSAASPLACGALCAGGTEEQVTALRNFGLAAGLAFQLQDDLLNLVGSDETHTKDFRSDITEGKRTLIAVHALQQLDLVRAEELHQILSSGSSDPTLLSRGVALMEAAGSIAYVRDFANQLVKEAQAIVESAPLTSEAVSLLLSMAAFFVLRSS